MNITSEYLQSFITNNFDIVDKFSLSPLAKSVLQKNYEYLYNANLAYKSAIISKEEYHYSPELFFLIPQPIQHMIRDDFTKYVYSYKFTINSRTFFVTFFLHSENDMNISQCLKRIYTWLHIVDKYAPSICSKILKINIFFTEHMKYLPNKGETIDEIHVNTAFTTSCSPSTEINIFRKEEWFKVFIHETFHSLGLDFSSMNNEDVCSRILSIFPVKSEVRLFETYCETWAEIFNLLFLTFYSTKPYNNFSSMLNKFESLLQTEIIFSIFQSNKVLHHNNMNYLDLFHDSMSSVNKRAKYNESTHLLSYYVIKSILIYHTNEFLEWCVTNNNNIINFKKTNKNLHNYCRLIEKKYNDKKYIDITLTFDEWFHNKENTDYPTFENQTMRMTVYENK